MTAKSNALITAISTMRGGFAARIFCACLAQVQYRADLTPEREFVIIAADIATMSGFPYQQTPYRSLHRGTQELKRCIVKIKTKPNGAKGAPVRTELSIVDPCVYDPRSGEIRLHFTPWIIPFISNLCSHYTVLSVASLMRLRSRHSQRLYELLAQALWERKNFTPADLRNLMGLEKNYEQIGSFRRRALEPAIIAINEHTELNVKLELNSQGQGGKIIDFVFTIKRAPANPKKSRPSMAELPDTKLSKYARPGEKMATTRQRVNSSPPNPWHPKQNKNKPEHISISTMPKWTPPPDTSNDPAAQTAHAQFKKDKKKLFG